MAYLPNAIHIDIQRLWHVKWIWEIQGHPNYKWDENKVLYNTRTGRKVKKTLNARCVGYWIDRKFISLTKLRTLLQKADKEPCPF